MNKQEFERLVVVSYYKNFVKGDHIRLTFMLLLSARADFVIQ